jgi:DNA primase
MPATSPLDWSQIRATLNPDELFDRLLGPPPGRQGERSSRLRRWNCPSGTHPDANPSFTQKSGEWSARCYGCDWSADPVDVARLLNPTWSFRDAVNFLAGDQNLTPRARPNHPPAKKRAKTTDDGVPSMLDSLAALDLVHAAADALWSDAGAEALAYLRGRGLQDDTLRRFHVGWTPGLPLRGRPEGICLPWFDDDQLECLKIRQPDHRRPKYREVFRGEPRLYPGPGLLEPGRPLVICEGEIDSLLLIQEIGDLAAVATLGSASAKPTDSILWQMLSCSPWVIAVDNDKAGAERASKWAGLGRRCVRVIPPAKDWGESHLMGSRVIRYHLGRVLCPAPVWEELEPLRWNPELEQPEQATP